MQIVRRRLEALYPSAPQEILGFAAEAAVRSARRYDNCAALKDGVLHQAIRTVIRHVVLAYDETRKALGGWLDDDLYRVLHAKFCDLANLIAFQYAKPRAAAPVQKQRRIYPPQVRRRR